MGVKKVGLGSTTSSWLTAVKNAFRSSSSSSKKQDNGGSGNGNGNSNSKKKSNKRREEESGPEELQEKEKKREKRCRWVFSKSVTKDNKANKLNAEMVRLTSSSAFLKELNAIVVIQTALRGFLARKALHALKGLVKLQALVRGQNARKQAKMTLQHIQALVRVQDQMRDQRARLSHEGGRRSSMYANTNNCSSWDSKLLHPVSGDGKGHLERSRALDEIDKMLQTRKEALMKRDKALAYAFSQQIQRSSSGPESEIDNQGTNWLDRWMAAKQWESRNNHSVKTVEVDASRPHSYAASHMARSLQQTNHQRPASPQRVASPRRYQSPATPSTPKIRPLQVLSASPRYFKEETSYSASATHTPNFGSAYKLIANPMDEEQIIPNDVEALPNYMTATESAKAKARSQSAPRTRPPTPERERSGSVKKRLSYQPEAHLARASVTFRCGGSSQDLRIPSFKSYGLEQQSSNLSSYYTDILAEEISPYSTADLGKWLR